MGQGYLADAVSDHLWEFLWQNLKYRPVQNRKIPYVASMTSLLEEQNLFFIVGLRKLWTSDSVCIKNTLNTTGVVCVTTLADLQKTAIQPGMELCSP